MANLETIEYYRGNVDQLNFFKAKRYEKAAESFESLPSPLRSCVESDAKLELIAQGYDGLTEVKVVPDTTFLGFTLTYKVTGIPVRVIG